MLRRLRWRSCGDMKFGMGCYIHSVKLHDTVYFGGGIVKPEDPLNCHLMRYNMALQKWETSIKCTVSGYAMVLIEERLVLVGGKDGSSHCSRKLAVWDQLEQSWVRQYLDMTVARFRCSAVTHEDWLVVAGGQNTPAPTALSSVEILNTIGVNQWQCVSTSTPVPWLDMKTAMVGDVCYFMGGCTITQSGQRLQATSNVYSMSISALLQQHQLQNSDQIWNEIPRLPCERSSPLSLCGNYLLAVGGKDVSTRRAVSKIFYFSPAKNMWIEQRLQLPCPRYDCALVMISHNEIALAGGYAARDHNITTMIIGTM